MTSCESKILLISNSTVFGRGYLDHVEEEIRDHLGAARKVLFVPFAMFDRAAYADMVRERLARMGYGVTSVHDVPPGSALDATDAIFVGGGNTFRLLKGLYDHDLLEPIRGMVDRGVPFIGSSAGSIVAGPTIKTTKDMPVVEPRSFVSLGIVPFQISPHYLDPDPDSTHMGETQEERINQFLEEEATPVVGLREGAYLGVTEGSVQLKGIAGARVFRRGREPVETLPGDDIFDLVNGN